MSTSPFTDTCKQEYLVSLQKLMSAKQATVFSTTYCGYCTKAKKLLKQHDVEYNEVMLDEIAQGDAYEVSNCIYGKGERKTVPVIFMDNKKVGGYGELMDMQKQGAINKV